MEAGSGEVRFFINYRPGRRSKRGLGDISGGLSGCRIGDGTTMVAGGGTGQCDQSGGQGQGTQQGWK
jgi:hypothetical protein